MTVIADMYCTRLANSPYVSVGIRTTVHTYFGYISSLYTYCCTKHFVCRVLADVCIICCIVASWDVVSQSFSAPTELQNLLYVSLVATMLFSTGELVPLAVYGMPPSRGCSVCSLSHSGFIVSVAPLTAAMCAPIGCTHLMYIFTQGTHIILAKFGVSIQVHMHTAAVAESSLQGISRVYILIRLYPSTCWCPSVSWLHYRHWLGLCTSILLLWQLTKSQMTRVT